MKYRIKDTGRFLKSLVIIIFGILFGIDTACEMIDFQSFIADDFTAAVVKVLSVFVGPLMVTFGIFRNVTDDDVDAIVKKVRELN